jgi:hypothetical protein
MDTQIFRTSTQLRERPPLLLTALGMSFIATDRIRVLMERFFGEWFGEGPDLMRIAH